MAEEDTSAEDSGLPADVLTAIKKNRKIDAIKRLREARGIDLKEAKDIVDTYIESLPPQTKNPSDKSDNGVGRLIIVAALLLAAYMAYRVLA